MKSLPCLSYRFWPHGSNPDTLFMAVTSPIHTDISLVHDSSSGTFVDYCEVRTLAFSCPMHCMLIP